MQTAIAILRWITATTILTAILAMMLYLARAI